MSIDFEVAKNTFADNLSDSALAAAIETWLDGLSATTVYEISTEHYQGFWHILVIYS